ncbi:DUF427 domain-containing protein [Mumia sp. DW29H23]|uniref:DUF427 domain-containing protein n=1 Tax=Mumia sp. DW29H23 TaxID=3421241 RepID=UPI003D693DDE
MADTPPTREITRLDFGPRLRGYVAGTLLVDTERALVISEPGKAVTFFAVPADDVRSDLLSPAEPSPTALHPGAAHGWDLVVDGDRRAAAAWEYAIDGLDGYVGLRFDALDSWLQEDEPVAIHPRSSRHRVDAVPSTRHVVIRVGDQVVADTRRPVAVFETGLPTRWYIPLADLDRAALVDLPLHTGCPYKGTASYYAHASDPERAVAWYYPDPLPEVAGIAGHVAFFDELVTTEVDGGRREPPVTQWTYGLRDNLRGGGSGAHQGTDSPHDHPRTRPEETPVSITVTDLDADGALSRRHPVPPGAFTYEPSERRVRGTIDGLDVVDSLAPLLVWEPGSAVPGYVFPRADVRTDLLAPTAPPAHGRHPQVAQWYNLHLGEEVYEALVFAYDVDGLRDHLGVDWFRRREAGVEHWYEEDEEIFRHPRDPYKRVDPIRSSRHVEVFVEGVKVADSRRPVLLFETRLPVRYYLPAEDVDFTHLRETSLSTTCPYKGDARYWSYDDGTTTRENIVWSYPTPIRAAEAITDLVAFYNEVVDIVVDGVPLERPESEFSAALGAGAAPAAATPVPAATP